MSKPLVGLQVHRVLSFRKMFCGCRYSREKAVKRFEQIRLGGKVFNYEGDYDKTCDYQFDQVPPVMNYRILKGVRRILEDFGCRVLDPIIFCRKLILDGSIPSGYQITALVGEGGQIILKNGRKISLKGVYLQTDSGTPSEKGYSLNRLGLPLLEVTTEPEYLDNQEVVDSLKRIEEIINPLNLLPRSSEAIRQDINLSIPGVHPRVELKGVDSLSRLSAVINKEIERMRATNQTLVSTRKVLPNNETEHVRYPKGSARMFPETDLPAFHLLVARRRLKILKEFRNYVRGEREGRLLNNYLAKYGFYSFDRPIIQFCLQRRKTSDLKSYYLNELSAEEVIRGKKRDLLNKDFLIKEHQRLGEADFFKKYRTQVTRDIRILFVVKRNK